MNKDPLALDLRIKPPSRRYLGIWVGIATVAVATATLFCEAHLTAVPVEQTMMTAAIMILSCFIMYTSLFDAGHEKAEEADDYCKVQTAYHAARDAAQGEIQALEGFCRLYCERELAECRHRILASAGLTEEDYILYRDRSYPKNAWRKLPRIKRRAMRAATRLKAIRLHASMLLSGDRAARRAPMLSARPAKMRRTAVALLPTFIGCLITVAVTLESMQMTPAAIISGILRIFTIVWCGVRGFTAGSRSVVEDDTTVLESKTALLSAFLAERPTQN